MSEVSRNSHDVLPAEWQRRIGLTCARFEAACTGRPRIEDYLDGWPEPARSALLRELIGRELVHRRRRGEPCRAPEYHERFPGLDPAWLAGMVAGIADPPAAARNGEPAPDGLPPLHDCEIGPLLGRGGMSDVYRARQRVLNRAVAVKMFRTSVSPHVLALFRGEAEAVARLKHPNVIQVHEVGERDGRPCLVLELAEGGSLARKLVGKPQPGKAAAELVQTLAWAIHHAHEQGIVHCDLKPSNVLITADGTLKITDFGIARLLEHDAPDGAVMGTPSYMAPEQVAALSYLAPEQVAGLFRQVGPHTDVYALGAILYELLTGWPPFNETTPRETLRRVLTRRPIPLSMVQVKVHADLETICLKCLEKLPENRYASARELALDLGRFLNHEPIEAEPAGPWQRLVSLLRRPMHLHEIGRWGAATLWDAVVTLAGHGTMFGLIQADAPVGLLWLWLLGYEALCLWLFWHLVLRQDGRLTDTERDLRNLWVGYAFAGVALLWVNCPPYGSSRAADALPCYPPLAVVMGVILFAEGRMYWGRLYLVGLAFFALAGLMRLKLAWAPVFFGGAYALTILYLGYHGLRAAHEAADTRGALDRVALPVRNSLSRLGGRWR